MKFDVLLKTVADYPIFDTGLLLAGEVDPGDVRRQLSRWVSRGKVIQLRRGLYTLAPPYNKTKPHPFAVANALRIGSYVSGQSALAFYGMIPEFVPEIISVSTRNPEYWENPLGNFNFRHIAPHFFFGYQQVDLPQGQKAFIAHPEKALLDLIHLTPGSDSLAFLRELRLQNIENLDKQRLLKFTQLAKKPKWERAASQINDLILEEESEFLPLAV